MGRGSRDGGKKEKMRKELRCVMSRYQTLRANVIIMYRKYVLIRILKTSAHF